MSLLDHHAQRDLFSIDRVPLDSSDPSATPSAKTAMSDVELNAADIMDIDATKVAPKRKAGEGVADDKENAKLPAKGSAPPQTPATKKARTAGASSSSALDSPSVVNGSPAGAPASNVQLKNGKLALTQKALSWQKSMATLKAIFELNAHLDECSEPLKEVPDQFLHVIAKLTQESDKSLLDLAKQIKNVITPVSDADTDESQEADAKKDILSVAAYKSAIAKVAERVNYGLDGSCLASTSTATDNLDEAFPPAVQIWRWEVHDTSMLDGEDKMLARRQERQQAREEAKRLIADLPYEEQVQLLTRKRTKAASAKTGGETEREEAEKRVKALGDAIGKTDAAKAGDDAYEEDDEMHTPPPLTVGSSAPSSATTAVSKSGKNIIVIDDDDDDADESDVESCSPTKAGSSGSKSASVSPSKPKLSSGSPSKPKTKSSKSGKSKAEDDAKAAEREEKRRAREEKKAELEAKKAQKEAEELKKKKRLEKQQSVLGAFLKRPVSPVKRAGPPGLMGSPTSSRTKLSDFEETFKPCLFKDVAPINRLGGKLDVKLLDSQLDASKDSRDTLFADFKRRMPLRHPAKGALPSRRGIHPPLNVRETMHAITEASVMGLGGEIKLLEAVRKDRTKLPIKLLQFESDRRPPWFGTHSKSTNMFNARQPLRADTVALDYSYDSDAEWEDVGAISGDDMNDADDKEEDAGSASEADSELDDWLVDDLEEEEVPEDDDDSIMEVDAKGKAITSPRRARSTTAEPAPHVLKPKKKRIKPLGRRFTAKLVPFQTGPHWELELGQPIYDNFKPYTIEFLNGAAPGLNPFEYQAPVLETSSGGGADADSKTAAPSTLPGPKAAAASRKPGGTLQALWTQVNAEDDALPMGPPPVTKLQPKPGPAKGAFPDASLPELLRAIEGNTKPKVVLVEELKEQFSKLGRGASKSNIEACIATYAEKEGGRKAGAKWIVKAEHRKMAGLP